MTIGDILALVEFKDGVSIGGLILIILLTLIQISPIKINPWDLILHWIGDRLTSNIKKQVSSLEKKLDKHIAESAERDLKDTRAQILAFCNSCMNGTRHSKEQFDFIIKQCDDYETYIAENDIRNGVIESAMKEIRRLYDKCIQNNSFLKEGQDPEPFAMKTGMDQAQVRQATEAIRGGRC